MSNNATDSHPPPRKDLIEKFGVAGLTGVVAGGSVAFFLQGSSTWALEVFKANGLAGLVILGLSFVAIALWKEIKSQRRELNQLHKARIEDLEERSASNEALIEKVTVALNRSSRH